MCVKDKIARIKYLRLSKEEVYLIESFNKCEQFTYDDSVYYIHDKEVYFEVYDNILYCNKESTWNILNNDYAVFRNYYVIQDFIMTTMNNYYGKAYKDALPKIFQHSYSWYKASSKYKRKKFLNKLMIWK